MGRPLFSNDPTAPSGPANLPPRVEPTRPGPSALTRPAERTRPQSRRRKHSLRSPRRKPEVPCGILEVAVPAAAPPLVNSRPAGGAGGPLPVAGRARPWGLGTRRAEASRCCALRGLCPLGVAGRDRALVWRGQSVTPAPSREACRICWSPRGRYSAARENAGCGGP